MLVNCNFIKGKDGFFRIRKDIFIKLKDFSLAEIFENSSNQMNKQDNGAYNAMKADVWSLGMILFQCKTGKQLNHTKISNQISAGSSIMHTQNSKSYPQEKYHKTFRSKSWLRQRFPDINWSVSNGTLKQYIGTIA